MRFGTLCSGIDGAAVAWPEWRHAYCAEIDPFCCRLLTRHYPDVANFGDITVKRDWPEVDVIVSGTPCQSFSVTGKRKGLNDAQGQLALAFVEILRRSAPQSFIWENVPGVLSSNGGRDFGALLRAVGQCGYGFAYRVLDARFFGVAQRRRRVYLVGVRQDWRRAASILFDSPTNGAVDSTIAKVRSTRARLLGWTGDETPKFGKEICPTLRASQGGEGVGVLWKDGGRRLTIQEWERLMGFPIGYTEGGTESERRRVLGNSFCPPVLAWIGKRLEAAVTPMRSKPATPAPQQNIALQQISSQLATITSVDEAKALRDKAEALRVYYQQVGNAKEIERQAVVVRLRAERRIGELLSATVRPGNPNCRAGRQLPSGITRDQSSKWQQVAKVPEPHFEKYLSGRGQLSTVGVIKLAREPKPESVEALAERGVNRLRAQIAERLGCSPNSKRVDRILSAAISGRLKIAI